MIMDHESWVICQGLLFLSRVSWEIDVWEVSSLLLSCLANG